jgi:hypothetical protein
LNWVCRQAWETQRHVPGYRRNLRRNARARQSARKGEAPIARYNSQSLQRWLSHLGCCCASFPRLCLRIFHGIFEILSSRARSSCCSTNPHCTEVAGRRRGSKVVLDRKPIKSSTVDVDNTVSIPNYSLALTPRIPCPLECLCTAPSRRL